MATASFEQAVGRRRLIILAGHVGDQLLGLTEAADAMDCLGRSECEGNKMQAEVWMHNEDRHDRDGYSTTHPTIEQFNPSSTCATE